MLALCEPVTGDDCSNYATTRHSGSVVDIVPFQAWHLDWLRLQSSQLALSSTLTRAYGRSLEVAGPAYSAFAGMDVIACAGIVELWPGRSQVWSLLGQEWSTYLKTVHRAVKVFLDGYKVRRLECVVDPRSEAAIRWATRLGFHVEHSDKDGNPMVMTAYTPQGEDQLMFVRIE